MRIGGFDSRPSMPRPFRAGDVHDVVDQLLDPYKVLVDADGADSDAEYVVVVRDVPGYCYPVEVIEETCTRAGGSGRDQMDTVAGRIVTHYCAHSPRFHFPLFPSPSLSNPLLIASS
jgi:hypothetical protein